ncbi:cyclin-dependent kinase 7-like [Tigriopus californicus]|uniref:cyclin-dependent kinase 7-like n=1 Tax=Tigriopus californicus TaxID=6832 RepID=UPI0027DA8D12|nr:cyclin-dependent kinase 7-like [Tigriopus californicus]|eukprot:TCALIF_05782-PA protein Name:"Similar to cdk7 Cyclin-dependent kinase 7 (Carassius auratus)" AED:0.04 eAED:0.04 QI:105/1/1/1/1/1/3/195/356
MLDDDELEADERSKRYEKISFLGEGQFATVYKAKDLTMVAEEGEESDCIVAIKKIKLGSREETKDGINRTALREIKLLQELHHEHCINLRDVFGGVNSNISLVMDLMDTDLEIVIKDNTLVLSPANIKAYIVQTLLGLEYLHECWILHRDLKPNNLLVNRRGIVKLGDFGLAKSFGSPNRQYTHLVVTRWYRAPELLFGSRMYGTGVDIWAVGCILAELLLRLPFVAGETDLDQLAKIFMAMGTPTEETWPGHTQLPDYVKFKAYPGTPLPDIFTAAGPDLIQLLELLFAMDPNKRCTCTEALKLDYFKNKPYPTPGPQLPLPSGLKEESENLKPGSKRKLRDNIDGTGLAKRLVF